MDRSLKKTQETFSESCYSDGSANDSSETETLPEDLLLSFLDPVEETLQLSGPLPVHKLLSNAGV